MFLVQENETMVIKHLRLQIVLSNFLTYLKITNNSLVPCHNSLSSKGIEHFLKKVRIF